MRPTSELNCDRIFSNTAAITKVLALAGAGRYPVVLTGCRYNAKELRYRVDQTLRPDYKESLLDGLHVCLNPFANQPTNVAAIHRQSRAQVLS